MKVLIKIFFVAISIVSAPVFVYSQSSLNSGKVLTIATYQYGDNPRVQNIQPFATYFSEVSEIATEVKSFPNVALLLQAMNRGEVDIAFMNTFGYLMLREQSPAYEISAALHLPSEAASVYKTVIVSNKKHRIRTLENGVKNASDNLLVLVSPGSTSGNLVPRLKLASMMDGEPEPAFVEVQYRDRHDLALQVVLAGSEYALAAFGSEEYYKLGADTIKLDKLWESPPIPLGPVVCKKELPEQLKELLQKVLLQLHEQNSAALESVKAGWTEAKPADYFMKIDDSYYDGLINMAGSKDKAMRIIRKFAR